MTQNTEFTVNGRSYRIRQKPVVGICMDGGAMEYYDAAKGIMPNLRRFIESGSSGMVNTVVPSFTNPNNIAIVSGVPPVRNGVSGNYWFDPSRGQEVMMNTPEDLIAQTIFSGAESAGLSAAVITAKDKLCRMLRKDFSGICFSAEKADEATSGTHGIDDVTTSLMGRPQPGIYDPDLSVYLLEAGARLLTGRHFDLMYLTTTDFVQHKYAPGHPQANAFLAKMDYFIGALDRSGAIIGVTADHGMNAKTHPDGTPKVHFIEELLAERAGIESRVILPISDPYVAHHGSLGGYAMVHVDSTAADRARDFIRALDGIDLVLTREEAAARFQLPPEKLGDLIVLADQRTVVGRTPDWHQLDEIADGLRSHGALHEAIVPMILNRPVSPEYAERLRNGGLNNFDLFDVLFNGTIDG